MSTLIGKLSSVQLLALPSLGLMQTTAPILWRWISPKSSNLIYQVQVPANFYTDLASVPKWAWSLLDSGPVQLSAAGVLHDYAVRRGAQWSGVQGVHPFTAKTAITLMDHVMEHCGIHPADRLKVATALDVTAPFYWQRRDVDWEPF